jgi:hypothetical protein
MSTNEQYCAYIAKDKIMDSLRMKMRLCSVEEQRAYQNVIDWIELGLYDWQRGSE